MWKEDKSSKRTLGIRDKKILYERANHKCESCEKQIEFAEMQVGHKIAYSKGGSATLKNSVCLCYKCNNLQGTDSWNVFLKKMGKKPFGRSNMSSKKQDKSKKPRKKRFKHGDMFGNVYYSDKKHESILD
jgi:5-methylcytosine-specific restriction endonuclease McrA